MRLRESDFLYFCFSNNVKKKKKKWVGKSLLPKVGLRPKWVTIHIIIYGPIWGFFGFFCNSH